MDGKERTKQNRRIREAVDQKEVNKKSAITVLFWSQKSQVKMPFLNVMGRFEEKCQDRT
jgi:hypothetical protein